VAGKRQTGRSLISTIAAACTRATESAPELAVVRVIYCASELSSGTGSVKPEPRFDSRVEEIDMIRTKTLQCVTVDNDDRAFPPTIEQTASPIISKKAALTEDKVKAVQIDLDEALKAIAKKHGLTVAPSRIIYTESTFKFTVEFGDGVNPKYFNSTRKHGWKFGFTVEHIGQTFEDRSAQSLGKITFAGMSGPRRAGITDARRNPYSADAAIVARMMGLKPAAA
jgi:hypothetical protein